jgi:hypothetical protein
MSKSLYVISSIFLRALVATLSLLGVISCTKAAFAQQSYSLQSVHTSLTVKNQFFWMNDIAVDAQGRIYVLDSQNLKIHVSDIDGTWLYAIDLVVEDRNGGSLLINTDGTISVVTGRYESTRYIGTIRTYNTSGTVLNVFSLEDPDGIFTNAVRLSDGTIAAWGSKRPSVSTVWIFDASLNLLRTFPLQTAPGYGAGPLFAGLNGHIHYSTGNGIVVEISNTGTFVSAMTITVPGYEYMSVNGLIPLSSVKYLISVSHGFVFETTDAGTVTRQIISPSSNADRGIQRLCKFNDKLVFGQYTARENSVSVRDLNGIPLVTFGKKLNDVTIGKPKLNSVGWDNKAYATVRDTNGYSNGALFRISNEAAVEQSFITSLSDPISGNGFGINYEYRDVAIDSVGMVSVIYQQNLPIIIRLGSDGNYFDSYEYPTLFEGQDYGDLRCDANGNRYLLTQYYIRKISPSGEIVWRVRADGERFIAVTRDGTVLTKRGTPFGNMWVARNTQGVEQSVSPAPDIDGGNLIPDHNGDLLWKQNWDVSEIRKYDIYGNLLATIPLELPEDKRVSEFGVKRDGTIVASILTASPDYADSWIPGGIGTLTPNWSETVPPTSTVTTNPVVPSSGWYNGPVSLNFSASDNAHGSRVKSLQVSINSQSTVFNDPFAQAATLTAAGDGIHSVTYFATDYAGNVESLKSLDVRIDGTAPVTSASTVGGNVVLSASDSVSGVYKTYYSIGDTGVITVYSTPIPANAHKIYYWSVDNAGNVEVAKSIILNPAIESIAVSAARLTGGFGIVGTVRLSAVAPEGGTTVTLTSSQPNIVGVEPTVFIPAGQTDVEFEVDAIPVVAETMVTITAAAYATTKSVVVSIQSPQPSSLIFGVNLVSGGTSTTGTITISGPAPVGGTVVSLASSSLSALVPTSVTIPAGQMTATFAVSTNLVSNDTSAVISATVYGVKVKSTLSILGPKVTSVTVASANVASTATTTGTVTLSTNAPVGGKVVALSSSNVGVATVPVSVTVPSGSRTATFTITAGTVAVNTSVTITASTNGSTGTASVTVTPPAAALSGITTNVAAATGGVVVTGTVTLTRAAPTGGAVVTLASSSTTLGTVPASVTVSAGATSVTFTITTRTVTAASTLTVTGTYLGVAKSASITVNPVRLVSTLTLNPTSVKGGTNSTGTVTLTGPATEAVVVTLTSGTTTVARVPASVTVPVGATTATFTITTLTQTATRTSVITARTGTTSRTATLSVTR